MTSIRSGLAILLAGALWLTGCGALSDEGRTDWPAPSPALWHVTGPGGTEGWLFGTVHALPRGLDWRNPALDAALDQSSVLVVEIADLNDGDAASAAFMARARQPGLPPLSERVPPKDRPALREFMDRADMDDAELAGMESWAAGLLLANGARRHEPSQGVDRALLADAASVVGLESFAEQYDRFDRLTHDQQEKLLLGLANDVDGDRSDDHIVAWLTGDLQTLEHETGIGILADPDLRQALLTNRNLAWMDRIESLLTEGRRPFIAVGAAHMLGRDGLPALLEARGFTVARLQ
ncbi:hypothetical protein FHS61_002033 [Altererythrobacter atlanticus]|uniref:TraB family protein n=1 Tax=Croceibacterium atlanticum TaxID=1267766 RepID=A0A0F7KS16_9SPHN|nr:TraB/GumN family protein [Croceibacterium atlanticum]AKH41545.1 TraB family protein [Croceibacterium atlanticum]MBB5733007.1 hypothetical protein [Croceibacterium atlanticum]